MIQQDEVNLHTTFRFIGQHEQKLHKAFNLHEQQRVHFIKNNELDLFYEEYKEKFLASPLSQISDDQGYPDKGHRYQMSMSPRIQRGKLKKLGHADTTVQANYIHNVHINMYLHIMNLFQIIFSIE